MDLFYRGSVLSNLLPVEEATKAGSLSTLPSLTDSFILLTLTRLVVVFIFENFSFALFTPPLGYYQLPPY